MGRTVTCQHCHGNKTVKRFDLKKKVWVEEICPACGGRGVVNTRTV